MWISLPCGNPDALSRTERQHWERELSRADHQSRQARDTGNDPHLAAALLTRGAALNRLGRSREALDALLESVAYLGHDPYTQACAWREAACVHLNLANDAEAQEYLALALRLARDASHLTLQLDLLDDLAALHAALGDVHAACDTLRASLHLRRQHAQPGLTRTLVRLTLTELDLPPPERPTEALTGHTRELAALAPHDPLGGESWAALAHAHLHLDDPQAALHAAAQADPLLSASGQTRAALRVMADHARAHLRLGQPDQARHLLEAALRDPAAPTHPQEHAALHLAASELYEQLGEYARALRHHHQYHQLDRDERRAHQRERTRAAQARVALDVTRHETRLHRQRNDELEALVQARTQELRRSQRAVIDLLASAAEFRDAPLGPHTRWVGDATTAVALHLGCAPAHAEELGLAARLHDVGKIGIPDAILLKAGPLTPQERETIASHTRLGSQLLTQPGAADGGPLLRLAAQIALSHHECWDGSGYPHALRGPDIPLGGRIVRVVDTFDALVSARPYKPAWTDAEALSHLRQHAGTLFDPACVQALGDLHARGGLPARDGT
ncbi:HD domain-containing phosphohydrolase [Deinococcus actinosclerus]|uniref:HD-GYP domain-containing protein n=1 Tax=Deinococcus actinosclerus TaxID=1768108 RepID=A0ABN4K6Z1_9DEIO|nr:HD domain-containing phosphohydrolase [Deinococcus actinosclerus]ALW89889.1 hypothetical protein AUC44_14145 [Deinococcus actinosclerus]